MNTGFVRKENMLEHNNFKEKLLEEIKDLEEERERLLSSLSILPDGSLNVLHREGKTPQYYWYRGRGSRVYIQKKDIEQAKQLAQKEYNIKVLQIIEERLVQCKHLLDMYGTSISDVHKGLLTEKQLLVLPMLDDETYINKWYNNNPGNQNPFPFYTELYSNKGERMRSKSEKILADLFGKYNIPYVYEPAVKLEYGKIVYPDFLLLNVRLRKTIVYEHFGMMSDMNYSEKVCEKLLQYSNQNYLVGDRLLFSMESQNTPLNTKQVERLLLKYVL